MLNSGLADDPGRDAGTKLDETLLRSPRGRSPPDGTHHRATLALGLAGHRALRRRQRAKAKPSPATPRAPAAAGRAHTRVFRPEAGGFSRMEVP